MQTVYVFNYDSMVSDLLDSNIKEEDVEEIIKQIVWELHMGKVIEIDGNFIVGILTAGLLLENYNINCYQELLI